MIHLPDKWFVWCFRHKPWATCIPTRTQYIGSFERGAKQDWMNMRPDKTSCQVTWVMTAEHLMTWWFVQSSSRFNSPTTRCPASAGVPTLLLLTSIDSEIRLAITWSYSSTSVLHEVYIAKTRLLRRASHRTTYILPTNRRVEWCEFQPRLLQTDDLRWGAAVKDRCPSYKLSEADKKYLALYTWYFLPVYWPMYSNSEYPTRWGNNTTGCEWQSRRKVMESSRHTPHGALAARNHG